MSEWQTTVYGKNLDDIKKEAERQAAEFGLDGPLHYDIRPHTQSREFDGTQQVIDWEATVSVRFNPE